MTLLCFRRDFRYFSNYLDFFKFPSTTCLSSGNDVVSHERLGVFSGNNDVSHNRLGVDDGAGGLGGHDHVIHGGWTTFWCLSSWIETIVGSASNVE